MKYLIFFGFLVAGVPAMAIAAMAMGRMRRLLLAALVFSPVLGVRASINFASMEHYRGPDRGFELTLTDLIAWGLAAAALVKFPRRIVWIPYNTLWMSLFFILACVATHIAPDRFVASFTLTKLLRLYVVFWCVSNVLRIDGNLQPMRLGMIGLAAYLTLLVLQQKYLYGMYRAHGSFDHSNTIPLYANLVMPTLVIWALADRSLSARDSAITLGAALGLVFCVLATGSRAGTALAGTCLLAALGSVTLRNPSRRVHVASGVVLVGMVLGGLKAADTYINRFRNAPKASEEARDEFNHAAVMMARENLFGVGLNNFSKVLTEQSRYRQHIQVMANEEHAGVCHHIYLLTAAEMGYPGLVVFCVIIVRFVLLALRRAFRKGMLESLSLIGVFLGFMALHASGFLEWALRITPVSYQFMIVAGLCVYCANTVADQPLSTVGDTLPASEAPEPAETEKAVLPRPGGAGMVHPQDFAP